MKDYVEFSRDPSSPIDIIRKLRDWANNNNFNKSKFGFTVARKGRTQEYFIYLEEKGEYTIYMFDMDNINWRKDCVEYFSDKLDFNKLLEIISSVLYLDTYDLFYHKGLRSFKNKCEMSEREFNYIKLDC